jgi:hypothetical protein
LKLKLIEEKVPVGAEAEELVDVERELELSVLVLGRIVVEEVKEEDEAEVTRVMLVS